MKATRARRLTAATASLLGLSLVTGCAGSVYDLPLPGGPSTGDDPITVHAEFRDVLDLVPNSLVKVNDVNVGKITAIDLKGYTADVTLQLPKDTDLPDNTEATIRQTSLLGEKFVSLAPPASGSEGRLQNGDTIPLSRSGRNPEVEEVLGALSLLLNGGGVAQLRTIARELNNVTGGREDELRNTLEQLRQFTGQLDQRKQDVVRAIESLNRLAVAAKRQDSTIKLTLDELPSAVASINSQRADLVKTLKALDNLSDVGVRVIKETKSNTIRTLSDLTPVLDKLADAGSAFARSVQVSLTFPFVDETVGRNPVIARNLHFGDYVNLNANLDINQDFLSAGCKLLFGTVTQTLGNAGLSSQQINQLIARYITGPGGGCEQVSKNLTDILKGLQGLLGGLGLSDEVLNNATSALTDLLSTATGQNPAAGSTPTTGGTLQRQLQQLDQKDQQSDSSPGLGGLLGGGSSPTPKKSGGSGSPSSGPSTDSSTGSDSGGLLGGLFGMNRAATGADLDAAAQQGNGRRGDPLNGPVGTAKDLGYNSTLGALLLQGVSS